MRLFVPINQFITTDFRKFIDYYCEDYNDNSIWKSAMEFCSNQGKTVDEMDGTNFFWALSEESEHYECIMKKYNKKPIKVFSFGEDELTLYYYEE